jgi:hypothetical protein
VLESLTGISFPRSENTCTRCPAIVSLQANAFIEHPYAHISDSASFEAERTETVLDLSRIGEAIERMTEKLTRNTFIANTPIYIKVVRQSGPTFTLIDLPGKIRAVTCSRSATC